MYPGWVSGGNIDFFEAPDAWQKIYKTVANIAEAEYLRQDLSFENVRIMRTSGDQLITVVKLIVFNLIDKIEDLNLAITAPDRIGTLLLYLLKMPSGYRATNLFPILLSHSNRVVNGQSRPDQALWSVWVG